MKPNDAVKKTLHEWVDALDWVHGYTVDARSDGYVKVSFEGAVKKPLTSRQLTGDPNA